jgi:thioredoxin 1
MVRFDAPINADDASFRRVVVEAPFPVLAVFWSAQDASRRRLNDTLEEAARLYTGEILVVKLDISDSRRAQLAYSVHGVPQFLFFRDGAPIARVQGVPTIDMLRPWIEYLLGRAEKPSDTESITAEPVPSEQEVAEPPPETEPPPQEKPASKRRARKKKKKAKARSKEPLQEGEQEAAEGSPVDVTDADFSATVLEAEKPALVFFWAPDTPACDRVRPTVKAIAWEFAGQALVAEMDVEQNPETPTQYGAQTPPTIILFSKGQPAETATDAKSARELRGKLRALTGK